jgi:hypothetical protein
MGLYRDIWVIGGYGEAMGGYTWIYGYRDIVIQGYMGNRRLWGGYGEAMGGYGRLWEAMWCMEVMGGLWGVYFPSICDILGESI